MIKIAILGYGKMGKVYADWFQANDHCEICAVYNHTSHRKKEVEQEIPGAVFYDDWKKLMEESGADVVGLCTSTDQRLDQMQSAIQQDMHILCEKPICMDLDELQQLEKMLEGYDNVFCAASELHYHPVIQAVEENLGTLGNILHMDLHFSMYREEVKWKHRLQAGGGVLRELGQHLLDVATQWMGKPKNVFGRNKIVYPGRETEDLSISVIEYENNGTVSMINNYFDRSSNCYRGMLHGTQGQIEFQLSSYDTADSFVRVYTGVKDDVGYGAFKEIPVAVPNDIDRIYPGHMNSFKVQIDLFVDQVLKNDISSNDLANEMYSFQIINGSYLSQLDNKLVKLPIKHFNSERLKEEAFKYKKT